MTSIDVSESDAAGSWHDEAVFRFAVQGGPLTDPAALRDHARRVESLGYTELFTADHLGMTDPFVPLVVAAEATTELRVGPLVLNNEFHQPALLARTAATVDRLTGGRLVLGLGTGYAAAEHEAIGSPIRPPGRRVTRFGESLTVLRALLDEGSADHDGEHVSVHVDDLGVAPIQDRVPFLIGGHGRRVVELAAQHADVFQFTGLAMDADGGLTAGGFGLADLEQRSDWLTAAAGDRDADIERSALVQFTAVGDDVPSPRDLVDRFGLDERTIAESPFVLVGTVGAIVDKIERLRELLGITHYVVRDPDGFAPVLDVLS